MAYLQFSLAPAGHTQQLLQYVENCSALARPCSLIRPKDKLTKSEQAQYTKLWNRLQSQVAYGKDEAVSLSASFEGVSSAVSGAQRQHISAYLPVPAPVPAA